MAKTGTTRKTKERRSNGETIRRRVAAFGGLLPSFGVAVAMALGMVSPRPLRAASDSGGQQSPAPIERRAPERQQNNTFPVISASPAGQTHFGQASAGQGPAGQRHGPRKPNGQHLAVWLNQHSTLNLQEQQQALDQEPGFHDLPAETQQRYRNRLAQLDAMNPQRRQNILARNEAMERLSPDQRAQVRGALGQLGGLPQDQRHAVAQTFRSLRDLPLDQRYQALNSGRFGGQLNPAQREVLNHLLTVEPMLPPPNHPVPPSFQPGGQPMEQGYPR